MPPGSGPHRSRIERRRGGSRWRCYGLWCRVASGCRRRLARPCEASMIVLMSDRKQIGVRLRGERAPMLWDAGCGRREGRKIASTTSNWRRGWERREARLLVGSSWSRSWRSVAPKRRPLGPRPLAAAGKVGDDLWHNSSSIPDRAEDQQSRRFRPAALMLAILIFPRVVGSPVRSVRSERQRRRAFAFQVAIGEKGIRKWRRKCDGSRRVGRGVKGSAE